MTGCQRAAKRVTNRLWTTGDSLFQAICLGFLMVTAMVAAPVAFAQDSEPLLRPGEAYATRFSGITSDNGQVVIYPEGVVGSIVDITNPGVPPQGQHWVDEPQRMPLTAAQVGQVFGIALDDQNPPNIYLTATSAYGLHLNADKSDWMTGMWGPEGGPGTVYVLRADNGYQPEPFADIALGDRQNSGPALGNIAYDRWNKQLYVSDLETGMIHRLSADDGQDLGQFDHGTQGRTSFIDAVSGQQMSLPPVEFDPSTSAQVDECPAGNFENSPECWNFADFRRRVWGLGVRQDAATGEVRLYYAVWASQSFGNPDWKDAGDEQRNSVWSVAITQDGDFAPSSVRREFFLPDFFVDPNDIARAGYSNPVADIAFPKCAEQNVMLVAERGGIRNLGLAAENAFATPHELRVIRYELNDNGVWQPTGRYDVGFYDRAEQGAPFLRANSSGGVDFGLGYSDKVMVDPGLPNQTIWMTGDSLCSPLPNGACVNPQTGEHDDTSQVHGLQGTPFDALAELAPSAAYEGYPQDGPATAPEGPDQSYMIDLDINVDENGQPIAQEMARNDATTIGDVEIYVPCEGPPPEEQTEAPPPPETVIPPAPPETFIPPAPPVHDAIMTHRRWGSPEHSPRATHRRWGSPEHTPRATHRRWGSPEHTPRATHRRWGSPEHSPRATHRRWGSPEHTPRATHRRWGSPEHGPQATHRIKGSVVHSRWKSKQHGITPVHSRWKSKQHGITPVHKRWKSKQQGITPVHKRWKSKQQGVTPVHKRSKSKQQGITPTHKRWKSKQQGVTPVHKRSKSKQQVITPTHKRWKSKQQGVTPVHKRSKSKQQGITPTHKRSKSKQLQQGQQNKIQVHKRKQSKQLQQRQQGQQQKIQVHKRKQSKQLQQRQQGQQQKIQVHRRKLSKQQQTQ